MLGSVSEDDDVVQDAWLRLESADVSAVDNLDAWLTIVVARVCLNLLRSRRQRREEPLDVYVPDPIISHTDGVDPEHQALLADSVGLALLVVLETLAPSERLAFVLHDMFAVPFDEIAPVIDRSPAAASQLASRGRRRVRRQAAAPDLDLARQRELVDAFFAASAMATRWARRRAGPQRRVPVRRRPLPSRFTVEIAGARAVAAQAPHLRVRAAFPIRTTSADQRSCRGRGCTSRAAVVRHGLHGHRQQNRRHRHAGRSPMPAPLDLSVLDR
jgi:RNA polymerase sigma factor (sigma-70 family)